MRVACLEPRTMAGNMQQVVSCGLDGDDPNVGEIRGSSTDDIACWFIDSDYNDGSFFGCNAYSTGANEPDKKLQRAVEAEIDENVWAILYGAVGRPFDAPTTGRIAVKVISHHGDELLKVCEVSSEPLHAPVSAEAT